MSNEGSGTEAGERGHDNKERSEPVPHPEDVAGFANKPPPEHPASQQQKENCTKYEHIEIPDPFFKA